jgi:hypothetical protein
MPAKKQADQGRYVVLRDFGTWVAGDRIDIADDHEAALLIRDGMIAEPQEG